MRRSIAIVTIGMLTSLAGADSVAPYTTIPSGEPVDIYFDVATNLWSLTGPPESPVVYERPCAGDLPWPVGPVTTDPVGNEDCDDNGIDDDLDANADGDNNINTPNPDPTSNKITHIKTVSEGIHTGHPSNSAIQLTQLDFVMYTPATGAHGRVYLYLNDANETDLPQSAGGPTQAYARINMPEIPYAPGLYRVHLVNLNIRMPSMDAWVGFRMHHATNSPLLAIADPEAEGGVGTSKPQFAWSGEGELEPDRYTFGEDGPVGNFVMTLHGYEVCPADSDFSGFVDTDDFDVFVHSFEAGTTDGDFDGSGYVDLDDFIEFVEAFEAGC